MAKPFIAPLTLSEWKADPTRSTIDLSRKTITANGTDTSTITITLKDEKGNLITTEKKVQLDLQNSHFDNGTRSKTITFSGGTAITKITSTTAGQETITAQVDKIKLRPTSVQVNPGNPENVQIEGAEQPIVAGSNATLTVRLKDRHNSLISGKIVRGNISGIPKISEIIFTEKMAGSGIYTAEITSTIAGTATINATVEGRTIATQEITFIPGPVNAEKSEITFSKTTITANNNDSLTLTIIPRDAHSNAITTIPTHKIKFPTDKPDDLGTRFSPVTDNGNGTYTATLTAGTQPGELNVTTSVDGQTINSTTIILDEWKANTDHSQIQTEPAIITANDTDTSTLTLTLKDEKGNLITTAQTVRLAFAGSDRGASLSPATDNKNGTYTATLTAGTKPGKLPVQAFVNEQIVKQIPFTLSQWEVNATQSRIEVAPVNITAGEHSSITLTLRDDSGRLITSDRSAVLTLVGATFYPDGSAQKKITCRSGTGTAEITSTTVGQATITAQIGPVSLVPITLQVNPGPVVKVRLKVPTEPTVVGDPSQLMLFLKDNYGNLTTGGTVQGEITGLPGVSKSIDFIETQKKGVYKGTIESKIAGTANIKITVDGLSPPAKEITFIPGPPDATRSEINALPQFITANGQDKSTITVTLRDSYSNLITPNQNITFSLIDANLGKLSDISAHQDGSYKTALTAGKATGLVTVNALLDGELFKSTALTLKPWTASPNSTIVSVPSSITANGIEKSTITVTLVDNRNQRITSNQPVTLILTHAQFDDETRSKIITCHNGIGTAVITAATPGTATITAQVDQIMLGTTRVQVISGRVAPQESTFEILDDHRTVGHSIPLSLQLKDEHGHPISGKTARGKISGIPEISEVIFTEKRAGSGIYTAEITSTIAGTATINATVDGQPIATQEITFTPGPVDVNTSKIELSKSTITADNQDPLTITIKPYDAYGNVVATIPTDKIHLDFAGDDLGTKLDFVTAHQDGTYTTTLTAGTRIGRLVVTASVAGKMIQSPPIQLGVWRADRAKSKLTISPKIITANGKDKADITLILIDGKGQPVTSAKDIKLLITEGEELEERLSPVMNHQNGTYTATLTAGTQEGELTVYAFADKILVKSTILNLSKWQIDTSYSQVTVSPQKITANGKNSSTITINLRDDKNQPITVERSVGVTLTNAQFNDETQSTVIPCRDGNGTAEITSTTPGTATITAKVDQTTLARATVQVTKQLVDPISSYAEVLRKPHGGVDALTITVYLNDSSHQPVSSEANSILIQRVYSSARHQGEFYGRFSEMNSQGPQIMLQEIDTGKYTHAPIAYPNSSSDDYFRGFKIKVDTIDIPIRNPS